MQSPWLVKYGLLLLKHKPVQTALLGWVEVIRILDLDSSIVCCLTPVSVADIWGGILWSYQTVNSMLFLHDFSMIECGVRNSSFMAAETFYQQHKVFCHAYYFLEYFSNDLKQPFISLVTVIVSSIQCSSVIQILWSFHTFKAMKCCIIVYSNCFANNLFPIFYLKTQDLAWTDCQQRSWNQAMWG